MSQSHEAAIARSIKAYARQAGDYDERHHEIFNDGEQRRLRETLAIAIGEIRSGGNSALDYGCGSGNLSRHLLELDQKVTAADVSPEFLRMVSSRLGVKTLLLVDGDVHAVPDDSYDFIGLYSVLHHIPDYLGAIRALVSKLKVGGVLFIDHEHNDSHWNPPAALSEFRQEIASAKTGAWWDPEHKRWQYLLRAATSPSRHLFRLRRWRDARYSSEGDIHVWPDDHIEWDRVLGTIEAAGGEIVQRLDYLLYKNSYPVEMWTRYRTRCDDMSCVIARRRL